jgi:2-methylcitrate dehydratase
MDKNIDALSQFACELRFEELPQEAVNAAKRVLVDSLGCAVVGFPGEPSRIARATARRCVSDPPARILMTQEKSTPELAAFANGAMIRFEDINDGYLTRSSCHPSDSLAGILAIADATKASGKDVITAVVAAYEAACGFADVLDRERGLDNVFYCQVGDAVGCGKVLKLSLEQMTHAISLAIIPCVTLEQTRSGELSMWKGAAGPNTARNAVFAAQLAHDGMTAPADAIEGKWGLWNGIGRKFDFTPFGGNGRPFRITQIDVKRFPAVAHAQSPISAALELHSKVHYDEIEKIIVDTYWVASRYIDRTAAGWHPNTRETADHSIPYMVAAALVDGDFSAASFNQDRLRDSRILSLMEKMSVHEIPAYNAAFPEAWPCRIEVATKQGKRVVAEVEQFKGHHANPLTDDEIDEKFRRLSAGYLKETRIDTILEKLWKLESIGDIGEILAHFVSSDASAR